MFTKDVGIINLTAGKGASGMQTLIALVVVGFLAQLVDGAFGTA
jgi:hypothetical protein